MNTCERVVERQFFCPEVECAVTYFSSKSTVSVFFFSFRSLFSVCISQTDMLVFTGQGICQLVQSSQTQLWMV